MKNKFNWGWKIALLYSGFVIMMLVLVGMSVSQKIDLVADDYYAKELVHQQKIDKVSRAAALRESVSWQVNQAGVVLRFPREFAPRGVTGTVSFYCPADNGKDRTIPIAPDTASVQYVAADALQPGRYHIQVDWVAEGVTYWDEGVVTISKQKLTP